MSSNSSAAIARTAEPSLAARRATHAQLRQQLTGALDRTVLVALSDQMLVLDVAQAVLGERQAASGRRRRWSAAYT